MRIKFPTTGSKRALLVIDIQSSTLKCEAAHERLGIIRQFVQMANYDAYVVATYSAPEESMFFRQSHWLISDEQAGPTDAIVEEAVEAKPRPHIKIHKHIRSVMKVEEVRVFLEANSIDEVHAIGFDINDCVLATAYDALDLGYFSYVIEECSGRTDGNDGLIGAALSVLRKQNMTNNSTRHETSQLTIGED